MTKWSYLYLTLVITGIFIRTDFCVAVPQGESRVYTKGRQLIVQRRLEDGSLEKPSAYIIKGITWSAATRAPDKGPDPYHLDKTVSYGFFFDWPGRYPQGHVVFTHWLRSEYTKYYSTDIPLMRQMNVNTVRLYSDFGDDAEWYQKILDESYKSNIMVIMTIVSSREDIEAKRYRKVVELCKDHPAILMWSLGNEWNMDYNKYWGYDTVAEAARATNRVAAEIRKIDPYHPVSSCLGDRFEDEEVSNTVGWIIDNCPAVEVWGLNIYRGNKFTNLFLQWREITDRPMYLSEFGIDSFETETFTRVGDFQASNCKGRENQKTQVEYAISLWNDISKCLSALDPKEVCLGGTYYTFNDSLWRVGSYHVKLGGLLDYNNPVESRSYKVYNTAGFYLPGSIPDDVCNEEYFGVVDANRHPKQVFWELKKYYEEL